MGFPPSACSAKSFTMPFARLHRVLGLFLTRSLPMGKLYGVKFKFEFKIGNSSKDSKSEHKSRRLLFPDGEGFH
jgi:hypothetical protein